MTEPPDPLVGQFVGNYRITAMLGEGGMARVYRAVHPDIAREVAVKVMSADLARMADALHRFKVEAQAVNKIKHPGIVQVFDFGTLPDGRPFYIMELLEGESLAARLRRSGPLPVGDAIAIIDPMLDALEAAHQAQIVHRDLKPDNVFLETVGSRVVVKLLDFGIAKLMDDEQFMKTRSGMLLGTPAYMAPEQCAGRIRELGPRSDIYSVGCMLYQMLSGALPFNADSLGGLLLEHMNSQPPTLRERGVPGVPPALSDLVARCLAKEPAQRPASATELRAVLAGLGGGGLAATILAPAPPGATLPLHVVPAITPAPARSSLAAPTGHAVTAPTRAPAPALKIVAIVAGVALLTAGGTWLLTRRRGGGHSTAPAATPTPTASAPAGAPPDAAVVVTTSPTPLPATPDAALAATPPDAGSDLVSRLAALRKLCEAGALTPRECDQRRRAILDEFERTP
ncbi:MAG: serine/threonine protein kinase [Deltaproteobacteria bacterium]|nr:serine/threonine protein kinase [Deltaproteobacteria bacterium]